MTETRDPITWTQAQRGALLGAIVALLGELRSARTRDALALAEATLELTAGEPAGPEAFAAFRDDPWAEVAFMAIAVAGCIRDDELTLETVGRLKRYAEAAAIDPVWATVLGHAARGRRRLVTMALARRAPDGKQLLQRVWRERGALAIFDIARSITGKTPADPERGWWYKRLGLLPEGTVGRAFWANMTERGIALPGEAGGLPEGAVHHDLLHTLTGYGTDASGECEIAGFYAGLQYAGWPSWILAALTTFELGLQVGPMFVPPTRGQFCPRRVLAAARRGYAARFDPLSPEWDFGALMPLPLADARARLGI